MLLDEPGIKKSDIIAFVPASLRGDRFALYVENQKEWEDTPLYIFDEWVAYVNGSEVVLEEAAKKKPAGRSNEIFACAEFAVYATALGMAVEKHDARYFTDNDQFRAFLAWHVQRSLATYRKGAAQREFAWKPEYFRMLKSGAEGKAMRDFCATGWGWNCPACSIEVFACLLSSISTGRSALVTGGRGPGPGDRAGSGAAWRRRCRCRLECRRRGRDRRRGPCPGPPRASFRCDVSQEADVRAVVGQTIQTLGSHRHPRQ